MDNAYRVIDTIPFPDNEKVSFDNFIQLYECFSPREWLLPDTLFDVANYIAEKRPELVDLGTRINVQVNLYLRTILMYHENPDEIIDAPKSNNIGCFALTEAKAGVLSGLIVDVKFEETGDGYFLRSCDTSKKWISQGMTANNSLVMASNITNHKDCRIFLVPLDYSGVLRSRMKFDNLPFSRVLDLTEIMFDDVYLDKSAVLEKTISLNRKQLLSGIFYGRLCLSEVVMRSISGFVSMVFEKIKDIDKFKPIGHYQYIFELNNELIDYCKRMKERRKLLLDSEDVMLINCYKAYCVETAIVIYNKIHIMFGTHAFGYGLDYQTLILNKVAEGDTSVLKLACIKQYIVERGIYMLPIKHWYGIWRNPVSYVMNNTDDIFSFISKKQIDVLTTP
jgi:hypothetical protein